MLKIISEYLRAGERVNFTLTRDGSNGVRLLITPGLAPEPKDADEGARQVRAMLARPIVITATVDTLDSIGADHLAGAVAVRNDIAASYESLMDDLRKQSKAASALVTTKKPSVSAGKRAAGIATDAHVSAHRTAEPSATTAASDPEVLLEASGSDPAAASPTVDLFGE